MSKYIRKLCRAGECERSVLLHAHIENARILRHLVNQLQGRIEAGKFAALAACLDRSDRAIIEAGGS